MLINPKFCDFLMNLVSKKPIWVYLRNTFSFLVHRLKRCLHHLRRVFVYLYIIVYNLCSFFERMLRNQAWTLSVKAFIIKIVNLNRPTNLRPRTEHRRKRQRPSSPSLHQAPRPLGWKNPFYSALSLLKTTLFTIRANTHFVQVSRTYTKYFKKQLY